jgi:transcriptional repressor NrdR
VRCPFCAFEDTKVIDSRLVGEGDSVRRRRECSVCHERVTTYETIEMLLPRVIKRDHSRQSFNEQKLRYGFVKALEKCAVSSDAIEGAIQRIKRRLQACGEREISTQQLGEWVMDELRDLDSVAFIRFASVYHRFQDLRAFIEEIERLEGE